MTWKVKLGEDTMEWGRDDLIDYLAQYGRVVEKDKFCRLALEGERSFLSVTTYYDCAYVVVYGYLTEHIHPKPHAFSCLVEAVRWFQHAEGR